MPVSDSINSHGLYDGVLTNSLPRGGSALLAETVEMLGYRETQKETRLNYRTARKLAGTRRNETDTEKKIGVSPYSPWYLDSSVFRDWLKAVERGQGISVHIPHTPALSPVIKELNYCHVLIMRDPGAVLAALIFADEMPLHFLDADFETLSPAMRLRFMAEGGYAAKADAKVKSFAEVYRSMLAWRNDPDCLTVCYEELAGELGFQKQREAVKSIASHLHAEFDDDIFEKLNRADSSWAEKFRTGRMEEWKPAVDPESLEYIIAYCRPLCTEAGYKQ